LARLIHRIDSRDGAGKANRGQGPATKRWALRNLARNEKRLLLKAGSLLIDYFNGVPNGSMQACNNSIFKNRPAMILHQEHQLTSGCTRPPGLAVF
jgi:hypothetical protein